MRKPFIDNSSTEYNKFDRFSDMGEFVDVEKNVEVYLHFPKKCFSVRQSGIVCFHTNQLLMIDCDLIVQQGGRLKVLETKTKGVHAFIRGRIMKPTETTLDTLDFPYPGITYNPYKYDSFVALDLDGTYKVSRAKYIDADTQDGNPNILAGFPA